jgi:hypothetical protein
LVSWKVRALYFIGARKRVADKTVALLPAELPEIGTLSKWE